jgi:hypothetical protein
MIILFGGYLLACYGNGHGFLGFGLMKDCLKVLSCTKVIRKVRRLGGEGQFRHNIGASNAELGMKFYKTKELGPKLHGIKINPLFFLCD